MIPRFCLLVAVAALAQAQTGVVEGKVTNSVNGQPVKRATVVLRGVPAAGATGETYVSRSDAEGRFSIPDVAPGHYQAEASHSGFQAKPPDRAADATYLPQVEVEPGKPVKDLGLRLTPLGIIAGSVLDDNGKLVPKADVEVMQYRYTGGRRTLARVQRVQSDDRGEYFFSDLAPGRYSLRASNLEHDPPLSGGVENRGPSRARIYMPGYYGGSRDAAGAAALDVAPGAELDRVDIQVHRSFIYAIRGLAPLGSAQQIVRPAGEPSFSYASRMFGENGERFEIDGIPPGTYPLRVTKPQQSGLFAFRRVEVRNDDVDGLEMRNPTGRDVSGTVMLSDKATGPLESLLVILQPETPGSGTQAETTVKADGSFSVTGQPDAYFVRVRGAAGTYLKSVRLGDRELPDHRFNPGNDSGKLTLVMAADTGGVKGSVEDANGAPARLVKVTLIPDQRLPFWADSFQSGLTDANGMFSFTGVPPGDYRVYAWTDVEIGAPEDAEFRKPFEAQGASATVPPNGGVAVSLRAIVTGK